MKCGYLSKIRLLLSFLFVNKIYGRIDKRHKSAKEDFQSLPFLSKGTCKHTGFCMWVNFP